MKVYISGSHGVGKTSLCEGILRKHPNWWRTEYDDKRLKPQDHYNLFGFEDLYRRQLWRCLVYAKDELRFHTLLKQYPVLIIDRHPVDNIIYTETFCQMGWITGGQYERLKEIHDILFYDMEHADILIMPNLEWEKEKILRPKNTDDVRQYREDDWKYLELLRHNYEKRDWDLVIHTTDLNERVEFVEHCIEQRLDAEKEGVK